MTTSPATPVAHAAAAHANGLLPPSSLFSTSSSTAASLSACPFGFPPSSSTACPSPSTSSSRADSPSSFPSFPSSSSSALAPPPSPHLSCALDVKALEDNRPAVAKLKMLDEVQAQVGKKEVADRLIDHGLLKVIRKWSTLHLTPPLPSPPHPLHSASPPPSPPILSLTLPLTSLSLLAPPPCSPPSHACSLPPSRLTPLPDGSLQNIRLRSVLYKMLDSLPITETDLETSGGLGRTTMQLFSHEDETPLNKKFLAGLMEKWMRPMLGLKSTYKHLADVERQRALEIQRRSASLQPKRLPTIDTGRARIPEQANFDYAIRPSSLVDPDGEEEGEEKEERKKPEDEGRKVKMIKRLDKMKKSASAANGKARYKVDISGRTRTG